MQARRLDNGLQVIVAPHPLAPVVAVQAWIAAGSADEDPGQAGIAHVIEHMRFKGTARRGVGQVAREVESAGGEINAWTAFDQTVYHLVMPSARLSLACDLLADALLAPRFAAAELERERRVILEEIRQGDDDPVRQIAHLLFAAAFRDHPYGRPVIGGADIVTRLQRADLVEFSRRHYRAGDITLVLCGDLDATRGFALAERCFAALPRGCARRPLTPPPAPRSRVAIGPRAVSEARLALGFPIPPLDHPDVPALDVLAVALGQGESSRLSNRLTRDGRLASSVHAYVHALRQAGLFAISATASPDALVASAAGIVGEIVRACDGDLDGGEVARAVRAIEADAVYQLESIEGLARRIGHHAVVAGDPAFEARYLAAVRALDPAALTRVARRYLRPGAAVLAAVGPERRGLAAGLRGALADARPPVRVTRPVDHLVRHRVAGGPTVVIQRDDRVPMVAARAMWSGGVRLERPVESGLTNLLALGLTRGAGARSAAEVIAALDDVAASVTGFAGRNSFGLRAEWIARDFVGGPGLDLFADCLLAPRFEEAEIEREKRRALDDLRARAESASLQCFRLFSETLFGHHPYRHDVLGSPETLAGLGRAELAQAYRERYPAAAMTLAIVGDVDPDRAIAAIERRFAGGPPVVPPPVPPIEVARPGSRDVERVIDRRQAHLVVGFPGTTLDHPDRHALEVAIAILGGQGGRLFAELRDRLALAYQVGAVSMEGLDPGYLAVYLSTGPATLAAARAAVWRELERLRAAPPTAAEVARARRYLIGGHALGLQRRATRAAMLAAHHVFALPGDPLTGYPEAIARVGAADVHRACARYFDPAHAVSATVRPPADRPAPARRRASDPR